jgi:HEAT repeat protein
MRIGMRGCALTMLAAGVLLAGCGPDRGPQRGAAVNRQIPAPKEPPAPPPARPDKIDPALQTAARAEIEAHLASNDEFVRSHAIEAVQQTQGAAGQAIYLKGLTDPAAQVRFTSAMAVGHLRIGAAKDDLLRMINDPSRRVGIAVRFALHRLGDQRFTKDLETTAKDPLVWQLRAETAVVLGLLDEPTAVRVLKPMQRDAQAAVRIQVAEALWRLGDESGLKTLVSSTQSGYPDDQMIALLGLAGPRDRRVMGHLRGALTADFPEVCLVAARAMGTLGSDAGYAVAALGVRSTDARQRALAALALGAIGRSDAQAILAELLKDRDSADVRLAAAQALLQLKPPAASAGAGGVGGAVKPLT